MKNVLLLYLSVYAISVACYGQHFNQITYNGFNHFELDDTTYAYSDGDMELDYETFLPIYIKKRWIFHDSTELKLVMNSNGVVYYSETDSTGFNSGYGKLKTDSNQFVSTYIGEYKFHNTLIPEYDTSYRLVPFGNWSFDLDDITYQKVIFVDGKREGYSGVYLNHHLQQVDDSTLIQSFHYKNDRIIDVESHLPVFTKKQLNERLNGIWYHPKDYNFYFSGKNDHFFWYFMRNKPEFPVEYGITQTEFTPDHQGTFQVHLMCMQGEKPVRDFSWEVLDNSHIKINSTRYCVIYLNEQLLVLERED